MNNYKRRLTERQDRMCSRIFDYVLNQIGPDASHDVIDKYDDIINVWMDELIGRRERLRIQRQALKDHRLHSEESDPNM